MSGMLDDWIQKRQVANERVLASAGRLVDARAVSAQGGWCGPRPASSRGGRPGAVDSPGPLT